MSVINTNVKSLIVQNAIKVNNRLMSTAMNQLSTGKRINSAKDDAAGLAVTENMTAQIRGLNMAVRNANDGISLLQTAEGAMIEQTNMLQRMRELAVQAANGTLSPEQRSYLNLEYNSLLEEINRIGNNTVWNNMALLKGDMGLNGDGKIQFQVGSGVAATEQITVKIGRVSGQIFQSRSVAWSASATNQPAGGANTATALSVTITKAGVGSGSITVNANDALSGTTALSPTIQTTKKVINDRLAVLINADATWKEVVKASVDGNDNLVITATVPGSSGEFTVAGSSSIGGAAAVAATTATVVDSTTNPARLGDFSTSSISTPSAAMASISKVEAALNEISNQRASIGAGINRLTYASDNLSNISQNTSESRSRILDTDYAQATTELARTQIIQQASTAVLAQANAQPQSVLKLLQG
jgi:flagellin